MRVLIISNTLWPYGSGGELATYLFAKLLQEHDIRVKVVVKRGSRVREWSRLEVFKVADLGFGKYSVLTPESKRLIERLISWSDIVYFASTLLDLIPTVKSLGKPAVVHIHSYFPTCPIGHLYNFAYEDVCTPNRRYCGKCILMYEAMKWSTFRAIASYVANSLFGAKLFLQYVLHSDALIFVSNAQRIMFLNHAKALYNVTLPASYVIYNPLPDLNYVPLKGDDVGFLGGLDPIKGFYYLLKAWVKVLRKHSYSKLRTAMTMALPSDVEKLNIMRYPRLRGTKLDSFYEYCRAIVVPSICPEPSPYVTIEALLRGRLLIASKIGGIPEIVGDAPGARLILPKDIDALANALDWVLSMDRRDVVELGLRNREYVLKRFNNEKSIRELVRVFENVFKG